MIKKIKNLVLSDFIVIVFTNNYYFFSTMFVIKDILLNITIMIFYIMILLFYDILYIIEY